MRDDRTLSHCLPKICIELSGEGTAAETARLQFHFWGGGGEGGESGERLKVQLGQLVHGRVII